MGYEFEPLSGRIIDAALEVHMKLGPGFLESIYENAMEIALRHRGILHETQKQINIVFESVEVASTVWTCLSEGKSWWN